MLPGQKKIGIIGGGQLCKMLIEASRPWNTHYIVLEDDENCPAWRLADKLIKGSLMSASAIQELVKEIDILTYEIEHINTEALLELEKAGATIIPSPRIIQIIQDKGRQKAFYLENNLPTSHFILTENLQDLTDFLLAHPQKKYVIKSRRGGYDGKGVFVFDPAKHTPVQIPFDEPCVVEDFIPFAKELSMISARDQKGNIATYLIIEMDFYPDANLVEYLFSPADIDAEMAVRAKELAEAAVQAFDGIGIFAVEMFLTLEGNLLINEIAPRPHNSGHHTIEACYTSQFEQLNRRLMGFPLGSVELLKPAAMINLLGDQRFQGRYKLENEDKLLAIEGLYIHLYNKSLSKPHRKLGHITLLADDVVQLKEKVRLAKELILFLPQ